MNQRTKIPESNDDARVQHLELLLQQETQALAIVGNYVRVSTQQISQLARRSQRSNSQFAIRN